MEIELDVKLVVDLLKKEVWNPNSNDAFVADCREGLKEITLVCVQHCYQEANKCADALAKNCALLSQDSVVFVEPPSDVALLLSFDSVGTMYDNHAQSLEVAQLLVIISFPPKKRKRKKKI